MKPKVVLLPLDERPCNYGFPLKIFKETELNVVICPLDILGNKKQPANLKAIDDFLLKETKDAYGLVISIDMLLYGGIVPSRLHYQLEEELLTRISLLKTLKANNPKLIIYAFDLIMRSPQYSSSDEEPDYYEVCGMEIFKTGYIENRIEIGVATEEEKRALPKIKEKILPAYLADFLKRRAVNLKLNLASLALVNERIIDFLIFPQDDASEYGWTSKDQQVIRTEIEANHLAFDIYMYPDADAVANVLLSRMLLNYKQIKPLVYIRYLSPLAAASIPCLEDRYLDVSVRYQILASGALVASSSCEADIVLIVASGGYQMETGPDKNFNRSRNVTVLRNLVDGLEYASYLIDKNIPVIIADITFLNGSDLELIALLNKKEMLFKLASYAGWNTAANSLGTCIPHGLTTLLYGKTKAYYDFMTLRYLEDAMYCSIVRSKVTSRDLASHNYNYFNVEFSDGEIANIVKEEIIKNAEKYLSNLTNNYAIKRCYMPWRRMFEVGLDVEYHMTKGKST